MFAPPPREKLASFTFEIEAPWCDAQMLTCEAEGVVAFTHSGSANDPDDITEVYVSACFDAEGNTIEMEQIAVRERNPIKRDEWQWIAFTHWLDRRALEIALDDAGLLD